MLLKRTEKVLEIALASRALEKEMATRVVTPGKISFTLELAIRNMVADKKSAEEILKILRSGFAPLSKRAKDDIRIGMDDDSATNDLIKELEA